MNRVKIFVNPVSRKMLYFAMVHAHIVYYINIYCANRTKLTKLFLTQTEAIRIISTAGYGPLFKRPEILPLEKFLESQVYALFCLPFSFNET
jgi:hypothetical protein